MSPKKNDQYATPNTGTLIEVDKELLAPVGKRLAAFAIDLVLLALVGLLFGTMFYDFFAGMGNRGILVGFVLSLLYFSMYDSEVAKGKTIGKDRMNIKVVHRDGSFLTVPQSLLRSLVAVTPLFVIPLLQIPSIQASGVRSLVAILVYGIGGGTLLLLYINKLTRQGLHDLASRSFVEKRLTSERFTVEMPSKYLFLVGALILVVTLSATVKTVSYDNDIRAMSLEKQLLATDMAHTVSVHFGENSVERRGGVTKASYLNIDVKLKEKQDLEEAANSVMKQVVSSGVDINSLTRVTIIVSYGYNIGIAWQSSKKTVSNTPDEWREALGERVRRSIW